MKKKKRGLADPFVLKPVTSNDKKMLRVVIETPKGSRNKFAFNPKEHVFELRKVLPAGMAFPYDFGFVPAAAKRRNVAAQKVRRPKGRTTELLRFVSSARKLICRQLTSTDE
jgi:hypothetical protein